MNNKSRVDHNVHLSYRDVLLQPYGKSFGQIKSRREPDISSKICPGVHLDVPLISAPMDSITGARMAKALYQAGAMGILTRYINDPHEERKQLSDVNDLSREVPADHIAVAIGVKKNVEERTKSLVEAGAGVICLDIANGNHIFMKRALEVLKSFQKRNNGTPKIIAGNVATGESALRLADAGADAIKVGIGPGAVCTTRRVTGFGVPQFTAILDCAEALDVHGMHDVCLIADGGVRHPGDAVKALWAGADSVMLGYVFAGHDECPSPEGEKKYYRGMSSRNVSRREDIASEGVCVEIPNKGSVTSIVKEWSAAIRAACSMANAMDLQELRKNVTAIRVSTMSNEESDPIAGE